MKLTELLPVTTRCLADILVLAPCRHQYCPHEAAKTICEHYLTHTPAIMQDMRMPAFQILRATRELSAIYELVRSQYNDGRTCPGDSLLWLLQKLFSDAPARHPWQTIPGVIAEALSAGLIKLEGVDFEHLATSATQHNQE